MCVYMCVCMCVYMCVCMCVYMCVCTLLSLHIIGDNDNSNWIAGDARLNAPKLMSHKQFCLLIHDLFLHQ